MSFIRPSAAKQTTQTTGTGTLALIANSGDTRSFQQALGAGPIKGRFMLRGQGYYEQFRGTFTAPSTLTRDEVIISSNSNNLVTIPTGTTDVYLLDYAQFMVDTFTANRTLTNADASNSLIFKGSAFCTLTLPALSSALPDFWNYVKNEGTASFSVACAGSDVNDENGLGFTWLDPGEDAWIFVGEGSALWRISRNRAGAPGRNKLINGDMRIDQRRAGASVTPTGAAYTLDRWIANMSQASKFSVQRNAGAVTPPPGFANYLGITSLSSYSVLSGDYFLIGQSIEGLNVADLGWGTANAKPITLSLLVYSSLTGTFGGAVQNGSNNRSYPFSYSIPVANTWTPIAITIPGDTAGTWATDNTAGLILLLGLGVGATYSASAGAWSGSNKNSATGAVSIVGTNAAKFYFTGAQVEAGTIQTPFENRDYPSELVRCQRYFMSMGGDTSVDNFGVGNASSTTNVNIFVNFPVPMRVPPTLGASGNFNVTDGITNTSFTGPYASNAASTRNSAVGKTGLTGLTAFRPYFLFANSDLTARLTFDAEL